MLSLKRGDKNNQLKTKLGQFIKFHVRVIGFVVVYLVLDGFSVR